MQKTSPQRKMQSNRIQYSDAKVRCFFRRHKTNSLAQKLGASKRKYRKFSAVDIILSYWQLLSTGEFSYDKWAIQIGLLTNKAISGQALWKRLGKEMTELLKVLLHKSFQQKYNTFLSPAVFDYFTNVYIQDATHFSLPRVMSSIFPGSYSRFGESATAKIQAIFNIRSGLFAGFNLASFRDNDQKDSARIIGQLQEKDLVIRDLGYFVLSAFSKIIRKKAFFLSRFRYGVCLLDIQTGNPLDLHKLVKNKNGAIDMQVKLGKKEGITCRLIAVAVPQQVANERRRKAKNDRNKTANHKKGYMELLGYTIFITNVPDQIWDIEQVVKAYRARWYIEILFKSWKSNLKIKNNIPERYITPTRAEFFFYASLLMVNILVLPVFIDAFNKGLAQGKYISILKTCAFISVNIILFIQNSDPKSLIKSILQSCQYESRRRRINAIEYLINTNP